jgi:hypothetical protein
MRIRVGAGVLSVLAALTSCGGPTPSPSSGTGPPVGCFGVELEACRTAAAAAVEWLPAGRAPVTYIQAGSVECDQDQCQGRVLITLESGAERRLVTVDVVGGIAGEVTPVEAFDSGIRVEPTSPRLAASLVPFDLGHCGISSGIDVDGSFWDPVGFVNAAHPDTINSAPGTFVLTSPTTATLRTNGGLTVQLVRHQGSKFLPGCD